MNSEIRHQCLIYEGHPSSQMDELASVIIQKLRAGYRCLYLNNGTMIAELCTSLSNQGLNPDAEIASGRLILSSVPATTESGEFDVDLMIHNLEDALNQALKDGHAGLFASGDMTWEFGSEKNFSKLITYEARLENLFQERKELCGICQYHIDTLPLGFAKKALLTHRAVFINETLTILNSHFSDSPADEDVEDSQLDLTVSKLRKLQKKS